VSSALQSKPKTGKEAAYDISLNGVFVLKFMAHIPHSEINVQKKYVI